MFTLMLTMAVIVALSGAVFWIFKKVPKRFIVTGFIAFFVMTAFSTLLFPLPHSPMSITFITPEIPEELQDGEVIGQGGELVSLNSPNTDVLVQSVDGKYIGRARGITNGKAIVFINTQQLQTGVSITTVETPGYTDLSAYPILFDEENTIDTVTVNMNPGPDRVLQELDAMSIYLINFRLYDVVLYSFQLMLEGSYIGKFVAAMLLTFFWLLSGVLGLVIDLFYNGLMGTRKKVLHTREGMKNAQENARQKLRRD